MAIAYPRLVVGPHRPLAAAICLLAVSNVMTNEVLPSWAYLPWSLAMTAILLWLALGVDRVGPSRLGLGRDTWRRGTLVGVLVLTAIGIVLVVAALIPTTSELFEDRRVGEVSALGMAYQVFVRIPFGTVLLEEVAFRGVLLGMFLQRTTTGLAVLASSALFGLWHVLPSLDISEVNPVLADAFGGTGGAVAAVVLAVIGTALAGVVFCWLRLVSGSLVAPILTHVGTNSLGFLVAWFVIRSG